jgi:hypothetical protein
MCAGESARNLLTHDTVRLTLMVTDTDIATADVTSEARTAFEMQFANAVSQALRIGSDNIAIDTITVTPSSGTMRRWLQDLVDIIVSFTITIDSDSTATLMTRTRTLRNTTAATITVGDTSTADTSTFTQPVIVSLHSTPAGIECREGHDPESPLCRVCLDGWMEAGDQTCIECEGESVSWVKVAGLAIGLVVACLLLVASYLCYQKMAARGAKREAGSLRCVHDPPPHLPRTFGMQESNVT